MSWLWKRGDSGPESAPGPNGQEIEFHHRPPPAYLAGTLKDHHRVSPPLTDDELTTARTLEEVEQSSDQTSAGDGPAPVEAVHEDQLIRAETSADNERTSPGTLNEEELILADPIADRWPRSDDTQTNAETAMPEGLNDNELADAPAGNWGKRTSIRSGAIAASIVSVLGLGLIYYWPDGPIFDGGRSTSVSPEPDRVNGAGPGSGQYSGQQPGVRNGGAPFRAEEQDAPPADSPAPSDTSGRAEPQRASDETATPGVGELATRAPAKSPPPAKAEPVGKTAATGTQAPIETADVAAPAPVPPARAPAISPAPRATIPPAITGRSGVANTSRLVRTPAQWLGGGPSDADNPRGRYQGTVAVQVTIEPGGRVSNCVAIRGSGNAGLDAMTCRLLQARARFSPARDALGRPVASQARTTFVWGRRPRR